MELALLSNQIPFPSFLNPDFTQDTFKTCQASYLYVLNSTWLSRQSSKGECNPVLQLLTSQVLCRPKQDRAPSPDFQQQQQPVWSLSGPASAVLCHSQYKSVCRWEIQLPWLCLQWIFWLSLCCNACGTQPRPSVMSILCISCSVKPIQVLVLLQFRSFFSCGDHSSHLLLSGE